MYATSKEQSTNSQVDTTQGIKTTIAWIMRQTYHLSKLEDYLINVFITSKTSRLK